MHEAEFMDEPHVKRLNLEKKLANQRKEKSEQIIKENLIRKN